jgi:drug/metabolite transporter (DMT)-like permease
MLSAAAGHPRLAAILGALAIAFSGIFYLWSGVSPSTGVVFRCLYGLPILLVVAAGEWRALGPMSRRSIVLSAVAGVCFAADLITFHYAVDLIGAGLATVMGNLQVVLVALAAWALFGERPRAEVLVALPVMMAGVVLISGVVGSGAYGADPRGGVAIGLLTAISYAGYLLVIRRASPDQRPAGPVAIATAITAACAAVVGWLVGDLDLVPSLPAHAYLVALGVLSQSVGYLAIQVSLPRLPAVITSVLLLVQPVTTVVLAAILLRELPSIAQLAGVALVIGGIALATGSLRRLRDTLAARAPPLTRARAGGGAGQGQSVRPRPRGSAAGGCRCCRCTARGRVGAVDHRAQEPTGVALGEHLHQAVGVRELLAGLGQRVECHAGHGSRAVVHDRDPDGPVGRGAGPRTEQVPGLVVGGDDHQGLAPVAVLVDPGQDGVHRPVEGQLLLDHPAEVARVAREVGRAALDHQEEPVCVVVEDVDCPERHLAERRDGRDERHHERGGARVAAAVHLQRAPDLGHAEHAARRVAGRQGLERGPRLDQRPWIGATVAVGVATRGACLEGGPVGQVDPAVARVRDGPAGLAELRVARAHDHVGGRARDHLVADRGLLVAVPVVRDERAGGGVAERYAGHDAGCLAQALGNLDDVLDRRRPGSRRRSPSRRS